MHISLQLGSLSATVLLNAVHFPHDKGSGSPDPTNRGGEARLSEASADFAGIPLSSWVRERLRSAAIRELENAGQKIPFIPPMSLGDTDG